MSKKETKHHNKKAMSAASIVKMTVLICLTGNLIAQSWNFVHLKRGKVWATMHNSGQMGNILDVPGPNFEMAYPGYSNGADLSQTPNQNRGMGYYAYGEIDGVAHGYGIETREYLLEDKTSPLVDAALVKNYNMLDSSIPAEEMMTGAHTITDMGLEVHLRHMVWSNPTYDDFVVHEYTIKNPTSSTVSNFHFSHRHMSNLSQRGVFGGPSSTVIARYGDEKFDWDETRGLFYIWDDQSYDGGALLSDGVDPTDADNTVYAFGPGPERGDIGDPADAHVADATTSELLSPAYMAGIILDSGGGGTYTNITHAATGCQPTWCPQRPDHETPAYKGLADAAKFLSVMTYDQPRMSWDEAHAIHNDDTNPDGSYWERQPEVVNTAGPFELAPGAEVKVVFATVFGMMDMHKVVAGGVANIDLLAVESKAALLENVDACKALYGSNYAIADHAPPTPTDEENTLTITAKEGGLEVSFPKVSSSYQDPTLGTNDVAGYRVYRSTYFVSGPWFLAADISAGDVTGDNVTFLDPNLPLGVAHYYVATTYDAAGNESGKVNVNRNPKYADRAPNVNFPDERVYVVPNPFKQRSGLYGVGEDLRMEFINVPAQCEIRIYTPMGELIQAITHDDGTGGQSWGSVALLDYQVSKWRQYVAPGVYVFHVESKVSGQEGKSFIGKFAIIR